MCVRACESTCACCILVGILAHHSTRPLAVFDIKKSALSKFANEQTNPRTFVLYVYIKNIEYNERQEGATAEIVKPLPFAFKLK